jgi:3-methyl-2-oxobutanoate hydroxymethyltransferase
MMFGTQAGKELKQSGQKFAMLTCYDYTFARLLEQSDVDFLLVGDSMANVMLGKKTTREVTMEQMLAAVYAVSVGAPSKHIIADMPWESDADLPTAVKNGKSFLAAGAHSVKIEGFKPEIIKGVVDAAIPVVAHLGLTPQTATSYKQTARAEHEQAEILEHAQILEQCGIALLVVEHVPAKLGAKLQKHVGVPVIGIGAGEECDGQVLVLQDMLQLTTGPMAPFVKKFGQAREAVLAAVADYVKWSKS